ncbi:large T antigen [Epsilonpolyomavirus bovis]|uniref:Large T antigen n=3 Tax=Bovine polyomavirus TaxID=1891754 RepID=LT_POVBO|nr:large T antigen [Epsilonpolyomavirus bovis]P24851.2 RecName: Full=Large T antigen; Short=LT; Short=LT-AG [Epsilonpolyomavirus bovis]ALP46099.1 large T antigen [Bovine polyomavirus 1]ALW83509.1 large T antigen [Epsilonpolyomavirus bovis]QSM01502.1 MAG: large T antigen [Epsilonpolyomavirus bovis]UUA44189.1 large T antigen [Bovine polyomavirus 1]
MELTSEEYEELRGLLGTPDIGNADTLKKAFLKACKVHHPDKGGNEEAMKRLLYLYNKAKIAASATTSQVPEYGTSQWEQWWEEFNQGFDEQDLHCDEELEPSDNEEENPAGSQAPGSQATPPKKPRTSPDFPEVLKEYVSNALFTNRTYNCFIIFTTAEKGKELYPCIQAAYKCTFIALYMYNGDSVLYIITVGKHRVNAMENLCSKKCTVSFLQAKGVLKPQEAYNVCCTFELISQNIQGGLPSSFFNPVQEEEKSVNWKLISEFACSIKCTDPLLLMALYLEFTTAPEACKVCDNPRRLEHRRHHTKDHTLNALLFQDSKTQKTICNQACDTVLAKRRLDMKTLTRNELLVQRWQGLFQEMEDLFGARGEEHLAHRMAAVMWLNALHPNMPDVIFNYIKMVVENKPKQRYLLLKGPVNCGKTTVAAGLIGLCGGAYLNINCPPERLAFELGMAIDQFTVVFEDVKGKKSSKSSLQTGIGFENLDNLRDHLDGAVPVNLERKHQNKVTQIFPPGIVTCNEYDIPLTVKIRMYQKVELLHNYNLYKSLKNTEEVGKKRYLQSGITWLLLLIYFRSVDDFTEKLQECVVKWKERIETEVGDMWLLTMKENIEQGKNILEK